MLFSKTLKVRTLSTRFFGTSANPIYDVAIIGSGMSGLGAAQRLKAEGQKVIVLESQDRIGGRTWTAPLGPHKVDMGASWIHGIGLGVDNNADYAMQRSPLYEFVYKHDIKIHKTWDHEEDAHEVYYHYGHAGKQLSQAFMVFASKVITAAVDFKIPKSTNQDSTADEIKEMEKFITKIMRYAPPGELTQKELEEFIKAHCYEYEYAGASKNLSARYQATGFKFSGPEFIFQDGYHEIVRRIAADLEGNIKLKQRVTSIDYTETNENVIIKTQDQKEYQAKRAICTVPLGVLQNNIITFKPELPLKKTRAIDNIGIGPFEKIYFLFDECFWDKDADQINYIHEEVGRHAQMLNVYKYLGAPILLMFNTGEIGRRLCSWDDEKLYADALLAIKTMYPKTYRDPIAKSRTKWTTDENFFGAFSYGKANASTAKVVDQRDHHNNLSEGINDKLWFAGEHCHFQFQGTVHGAYLSGQKAVDEIINIVKGHELPPKNTKNKHHHK